MMKLNSYLYKALVKSEENDADILEHYGAFCFKLGKEEGLLFWKKAVKAGSTSTLIKEKIDEKSIWSKYHIAALFLSGFILSCKSKNP